MPHRPARIADHENEIARPGAFARHLQPVLRLVGDVVLGEGGRLAVLADIGAEEAPVAGVARPPPVVRFAAEHADALGRRVDQPDVTDLQLRDLEVPEPFKEGRDAAPKAALLARRHSLLDSSVDRVVAFAIGGDGRHPAGDGGGDLGHRRRHEHPRPGAVRQFLVAGPGEEAVGQQVPLRRRVELEAAGYAMVVGDDQTRRARRTMPCIRRARRRRPLAGR